MRIQSLNPHRYRLLHYGESISMRETGKVDERNYISLIFQPPISVGPLCALNHTPAFLLCTSPPEAAAAGCSSSQNFSLSSSTHLFSASLRRPVFGKFISGRRLVQDFFLHFLLCTCASICAIVICLQ